jgi:hypothetical protein
MSVLTQVEVDAGDMKLVAGLAELVSVVGIPSGGRVRSTAHTLKSLKKALEDQARFLRLLLPHMTADAIVNLTSRRRRNPSAPG